MFSAWNFSEWIQSILSFAFILSVSTGLGILLTKTLIRHFRDEPASLIPFPNSGRESVSLLKKAA